DGTAFVGIDGGGTVDNIFAIDKDGNKKWSYKSGAGKIYGSMSLSENNDTLFGADGGGYVFALNANDGSVIWNNQVSTRTYYTGTTLAADGKTLYCGFYTGNNDIKALNTSDGSVKWEYDIINGVTGTPVIGADGTIYFADLYRRLYALKDTVTGVDVMWKVEDEMSKTSNPFSLDVTRDIMYIGTQYNHFYAINLTDGSVKWENTDVDGVYLNGAAVAPDGTVYITSETDSMLRAVDPDNGETLWAYKLKDKVKAVPAIDNEGNIYIGDLSGYFHIVTKDGEELWKPVKLSGEIWSSCAISDDGTIYVVAYDPDNGGDRLYAIKAGGKAMEKEGWPTRGLNNKRQNSAYVDAIKVMSFNIYHGGATMDDDYDMDTIASVIKREEPVLVALQEVDNGTDRANGMDVAKELGDRCGMYYLFGRAIDYQNGEYGVAILSKYPIIDNKLISLPTDDDEEDRVALMVKVSINDKYLWFISTHFSYTDSQVQQAETITNEAFSLDAPVILGGDLNAEAGSDAINYMEQYWNKTYDDENIRNTFSSSSPTKKIDYIMFTSDDWSVVFDRVVIDKEASDHYAYVSYIKF
ncbi:MAG: PQQ-binding-like beta-propeller repeat protein, partial [Chlorobi bacterium]|nr:PQQ-binding-like beta-propeller repeat protein [Chlorobiota bacterium]